MPRTIDPLEKQIRRGRGSPPSSKPKLTKKRKNLVPSGCGILDVACSETPYGAWHLGTMANVVGDTHTGKTILALSGLACCANDERFDDHRLIYDDTESADNLVNMGHLFGKRLAKRIERPNPESRNLGSGTVEEFRANIYSALDKEKPFIYVIDSLDGLSSIEEQERVHKSGKSFDLENIKKDEGSFKTEKARLLGEMLRVFYGDLKGTNSLLLVISQVRANMDKFSRQKYRRNGGKALDHWCQQIVWMFQGQSLSKHKKTVWGEGRKVGGGVKCKITKNRLTGRQLSVDFDIYPDYGVDSIGSLVDWMVNEKRWKGNVKGSPIQAIELDLELKRTALINTIIEEGLEENLSEITSNYWLELMNLLKIDRAAPRFR